MNYVHLAVGGILPALPDLAPFKAILIAEQAVPDQFRELVSRWLVDAGALYAMAWGNSADLWRDTIVKANLSAFAAATTESVPDNQLVIATAHPREPMNEVFWFAKHTAIHPCRELADVLIAHIAPTDREQDLLTLYRNS